MTLLQLLDGVAVSKLLQLAYGKKVQTEDVQVGKVVYDSRAVQPGDVFVAIRGLKFDGHRFIQDAIHRGARAIVLEDDLAVPDSFFFHNEVLKVVVSSSRRALAQMAANYYHHPSRKLRLIGVTGTNGKTTTTHLLKSIFEASGEKVGLIGTIEYKIGEETVPATFTTPEALELNGLLDTMVEKDCRSVVMEVSSHALALDRVFGIEYDLALFTNLTQDHLDFHGSMEAYFGAKKILFDHLDSESIAVTNLDDSRGLSIVASTSATQMTYGILNRGDVGAEDVETGFDGISLTVTYRDQKIPVRSALLGGFNIYNLLGASAVALASGISGEAIQSGIANVKSVRGRFERIDSPAGWTAIIDYAHTPDALRKTLKSLREMLAGGRAGRIITIFGCGGDRDREKRPQMGKLASELSDVTIVTSDNPRSEDPEAIIKEILKGVQPNATVQQIVDRRLAIREGLKQARHGDVVLIAGKGHENYQVLGDQRVHFDDCEEVNLYLRSR